MRYLVMECHPGYVILLDEEGRFLKAANLRYEVGQIVYEPVLMKDKPEKQRHTIRWLTSGVAAIAACFLLFFGAHHYQNYMQIYSSIYLTINPEVQMDLNRQGTVVHLTGTNEDGKLLVEGYDSRGKDKVTVADELIDRAIEMGFLSEGGQVSFSIDTPDDALFQKFGTELRTTVTAHLDVRITVTIQIIRYGEGLSADSPAAAEPEKPVEASPPVEPNTSEPDNADYGVESGEGSDESSSVEPAVPAGADYSDTDYGSVSDAADSYTPPPVQPSAPADTDYSSGSDSVSDYADDASNYSDNDQEDEDDD